MAGRVSSVFLLIGALFLAVSVQEIYGGEAGGLTDPMTATPKIQRYIDMVRPDVESDVNRVLQGYKALIYRTQLVNGINYFIKVRDGDTYIHLRLYKSFGGAVRFVSAKDGMSYDDELAYF
ncbi:cystatin-A2-like [Asterias rubens]|uniref:cystatin-A2-like n=1 Tax=Asterias rubens TaxID=7604 RepID=UPI001454F015|nr:cystatin-A2-like [Asterias rubens]